MRTMMAASSAESGKTYKQLLVNDTWLIRRYSPAPLTFDDCVCSVAYNCPNSMWSAGLIMCNNGKGCTVNIPVWDTPGMILACTSIDSILNSDYRCFFNQDCIDMLLSLYNFDMPNRLPLPAPTLAISAMNNSILSRFVPNDTMNTLISELLIEQWSIISNFKGYYESCAPANCTYTVTERFDIGYAITTITGLCGGLVIVLRLVIPLIIRLIHLVIIYWRDGRFKIDWTEAIRCEGKSQFSFQLSGLSQSEQTDFN